MAIGNHIKNGKSYFNYPNKYYYIPSDASVQELVVGGGAFAGEIAYVACGSGVPDDLPEPPSFVSLLKEEGK